MHEWKQLWEDLSHQFMGSKPCLFAGDFNIIRNNSERRGGCSQPIYAMEDFNEWVHQCGLVEMKSKGCNFSWCNGQLGLARSWAKLDWIFMDFSLFSSFLQVVCSYLQRTTSDHSPMVSEFKMDPFSYGPSPFGFQQMWMNHPQFLECFRQAWSRSVVGQGLNKLAAKWTERDLLFLSAELDIWIHLKDTILAELSKLKCHMEGDRNTKIFHVCLANKRHKRVVEMMSSLKSIHQGVVDFFSNFLLGLPTRTPPDLSTLISPIILDTDHSGLCTVPSMTEVFSALSSRPPNSTPGLDGFGLGFFKSCWKVVKHRKLKRMPIV
ncbi:uncharacterized protein LOC122282220 [Carya illinoinensis]|uniref:uncharacterized protein LOC122282220 n=1 Tax=Carya illinoinensis TaxID=32201 RepID=UPI001C71A6B1|nr:uncharacterized protein LOC122282220 [Carya illinoinensis]